MTLWVLIVVFVEFGHFQHGGWKTEEACLQEKARLERLWAGKVKLAACEPYKAQQGSLQRTEP